MSYSVNQAKLSGWLHDCSTRLSSHGEIGFDESGLLLPTTIPFSKLRYTKDDNWTYFEEAAKEGFIDTPAYKSNFVYHFKISSLGWTFLHETYLPSWKKQGLRLWDNALTIVLAVLIALATQWIISWVGPKPQGNHVAVSHPTPPPP